MVVLVLLLVLELLELLELVLELLELLELLLLVLELALELLPMDGDVPEKSAGPVNPKAVRHGGPVHSGLPQLCFAAADSGSKAVKRLPKSCVVRLMAASVRSLSFASFVVSCDCAAASSSLANAEKSM